MVLLKFAVAIWTIVPEYENLISGSNMAESGIYVPDNEHSSSFSDVAALVYDCIKGIKTNRE